MIVFYLDCFYTSGLVYLINYRFSLQITQNENKQDVLDHSSNSLEDLKDFLTDINIGFNLNTKIDN